MEPTKLKKLIKLYVIFCAVVLIIFGIVSLYKSDKENNPNKSQLEQVDFTPIGQEVFAMSAETIRKYGLVKDVYGAQKGKEVTLSIIVDTSASRKYARELGDSYLRQVIVNSSSLQRNSETGSPSKQIGKTKFSYRIIVGYGPDEILGDGIKDSSNESLSWNN